MKGRGKPSNGASVVIDHIGIAVRYLEEGIKHWETVFGYKQFTDVITNTRQKVRVTFLTKRDSLMIKLIEPTDSGSSVYPFAQRGGGLHHLCFKCENLEEEISKLSSLGLRVLVKPEPGEAFENENIAFIIDKQGLNIELVATHKKAGILESSGGDRICNNPFF
jgi:methylmalonyl-CoA/ethylmalonyl-CoA epimerase